MDRNGVAAAAADDEHLAKLIHQFQLVGQITGHQINLPKIVAIGDQSSGKTSTLESSLVRRPFLPRGTGIVTRCPIIVSLLNRPGKPEELEFHKDDSDKQLVFQEPIEWQKVREEFEKRMEQRAGTNKGVSNEPIHVTFRAKDIPDLELVDLPGFTENPVGDQSKTICEDIEKLAMDYVDSEETLILAVTAANVDVVTSKSIKMSRKVDPKGTRTLGVITKPDLVLKQGDKREMERLVNVLKNDVLPMQNGYIAVRNHSQSSDDDDNDDVSREEGIREENDFFNDPYFEDIRERNGSQYLIRKLCTELGRRLSDFKPKLLEILDTRARKADQELSRLGYSPGVQDVDPELILSKVTTAFADELRRDLYGMDENVSMEEDRCGAEIRLKLKSEMRPAIEQARLKEDEEDLFRQKLTTADGNFTASRLHFLPASLLLNRAVKRLVSRYSQPVLRVLAQVKTILNVYLSKTVEEHVFLYPGLKRRILTLVLAKVEENARQTEETIETFIEAERNFVNIEHPNFGSFRRFLLPNYSGNSSPSSSFGAMSPPAESFASFLTDASLSKAGIPGEAWEAVKQLGPMATEFYRSNHTVGGGSRSRDSRMLCVPVDPAEQVDSFMEMVKAYMEIFETTLEDMVPKFIMLKLIRDTANFICKGDLPPLLVAKGGNGGVDRLEELVARSGDVQVGIEKAMADKEKIERARRAIMDFN